MYEDAWIFTGGAYAGVMKEVGDIFEKWTYKNDKAAFRVPVIGIASWNYTTGNRKLFTLNNSIIIYLFFKLRLRATEPMQTWKKSWY